MHISRIANSQRPDVTAHIAGWMHGRSLSPVARSANSQRPDVTASIAVDSRRSANSQRPDVTAPIAVDSRSHEEEKEEKEQDPQATSVLALDLSRVGLAETLARATSFSALRVLVLAGSPLECEELGSVLRSSPSLAYLDASYCGLTRLPHRGVWQSQLALSAVLLHENKLRSWDDIGSPLSAPALIWFSAFSNPISTKPEYRLYVLQVKYTLLLLDYWIVTDDERLMMMPHPPGFDAMSTRLREVEAMTNASQLRFLAQGTKTERWSLAYTDSLWGTRTPERLHLDVLSELEQIRGHAANCSAAVTLQRYRRQKTERIKLRGSISTQRRAIFRIQRWFRTLLWRFSIVRYTRNHLAKTDNIELFLSAEEIQRRNAFKLFDQCVRAWRVRRNKRLVDTAASITIQRWTRGHRARRLCFVTALRLDTHRRIYFTEFCAWEFLVILNVVQRRRRLPELPLFHAFGVADFLGLNVPDMESLDYEMGEFRLLSTIMQGFQTRHKRTGRFPEHIWDGPTHEMREIETPQATINALRTIRRRGCNFNVIHRQRFLESCASGPEHPIDLLDAGFDTSNEAYPSEMLQDQLSPEDPSIKKEQERRSPLGRFLEQAQRMGVRPRRRQGARRDRVAGPASKSERAKGVPLRNYSKKCWTSSRLLYYECPDANHAVELLRLLLAVTRDLLDNNDRLHMGPLNAGKNFFAQIRRDEPLVLRGIHPPPFMAQYFVERSAAATSIQATWRARSELSRLPVGLLTSCALRRAAMCIQRAWRWSLLRRRLEMLSGAVRAARQVRSHSLFIEERTLFALTDINTLERYPPFAAERDLAFGWKGTKLALVNHSAEAMQAAHPDVMPTKRRQPGLPVWLLAAAGLPALEVVLPEDDLLRQKSGVKALLLDDALPDRAEDSAVPVHVKSLAMQARLNCTNPDASMALCASAGHFRFVELRFQSLEQARLRALAFFLCTYNSKLRLGIPLVQKEIINHPWVGQQLLRAWNAYDLTWPKEDREPIKQLKDRDCLVVNEVMLDGCETRANRPVHHKSYDKMELYVAAAGNYLSLHPGEDENHIEDEHVYVDGPRPMKRSKLRKDIEREKALLADILAHDSADKASSHKLHALVKEAKAREPESESDDLAEKIRAAGLFQESKHQDMVVCQPPIMDERAKPKPWRPRAERHAAEEHIRQEKEAHLEEKRAQCQQVRDAKLSSLSTLWGNGRPSGPRTLMQGEYVSWVETIEDSASKGASELESELTSSTGDTKELVDECLREAYTRRRAATLASVAETVDEVAGFVTSEGGSSESEGGSISSISAKSEFINPEVILERHRRRQMEIEKTERKIQTRARRSIVRETSKLKRSLVLEAREQEISEIRHKNHKEVAMRKVRRDAQQQNKELRLQAACLMNAGEKASFRVQREIRLADERKYNEALRYQKELRTKQMYARNHEVLSQRRHEVDELKEELRMRKESRQLQLEKEVSESRRSIQELKARPRRLLSVESCDAWDSIESSSPSPTWEFSRAGSPRRVVVPSDASSETYWAAKPDRTKEAAMLLPPLSALPPHATTAQTLPATLFARPSPQGTQLLEVSPRGIEAVACRRKTENARPSPAPPPSFFASVSARERAKPWLARLGGPASAKGADVRMLSWPLSAR